MLCKMQPPAIVMECIHFYLAFVSPCIIFRDAYQTTALRSEMLCFKRKEARFSISECATENKQNKPHSGKAFEVFFAEIQVDVAKTTTIEKEVSFSTLHVEVPVQEPRHAGSTIGKNMCSPAGGRWFCPGHSFRRGSRSLRSKYREQRGNKTACRRKRVTWETI